MKRILGILVVLLVLSVSAWAQPGGGKSNEHGGGAVAHAAPRRGPAPVKSTGEVHSAPAPQEHHYSDATGHPEAPHVHANGKWVGHESGPGDARYHLDHPWE